MSSHVRERSSFMVMMVPLKREGEEEDGEEEEEEGEEEEEEGEPIHRAHITGKRR